MTFGFVFKTAVTSWFLHAVTKYSNLTAEWTELIIKHTNLNCFGILRIINRLKRSNILCFKTQLAYSLQPLMIMCKLFRWIWKRSDEVCVHAFSVISWPESVVSSRALETVKTQMHSSVNALHRCSTNHQSSAADAHAFLSWTRLKTPSVCLWSILSMQKQKRHTCQHFLKAMRLKTEQTDFCWSLLLFSWEKHPKIMGCLNL